MVILLSLTAATLIVGCGHNPIKKRPGMCYIAAALPALISVWGIWSGAFRSLPLWCARYVTPMLTHGALAAALFLFVMFAGAVPNGSAFMKLVMPIRGELSILASVLAIGHAAALAKGQLRHILSASPEAETVIALAVSLLLLLVMMPLFVTSFRRVRRRMKPARWKRLQRWAYGFYALLFLHILFFNFTRARDGSAEARVNVAVYGALFLSYAVMRIRKALVKRDAPAPFLPGVLGGCAMAGLLLAVLLPGSVPEGVEREELEALAAEVADLRKELEEARLSPEADAPAEDTPSDAEETTALYADGKYTGAGIGYNGRLTVSVVIESGAIQEVDLTGSVDDEEYVRDAVAGLFPAVIEAQSTDVDAVSGATSTSDGLLAAIDDALEKAVKGE